MRQMRLSHIDWFAQGRKESGKDFANLVPRHAIEGPVRESGHQPHEGLCLKA